MRPDDGVFADQVVRPEMRQRQPLLDVLPLLWSFVPPMLWFQDWRPLPPETLHLKLIMIINLDSCPFRSSRNPDPETRCGTWVPYPAWDPNLSPDLQKIGIIRDWINFPLYDVAIHIYRSGSVMLLLRYLKSGFRLVLVP
jgi:hypothetical protein